MRQVFRVSMNLEDVYISISLLGLLWHQFFCRHAVGSRTLVVDFFQGHCLWWLDS
jgi:hypothetical protein